jgi:hypothetical protein
MKQSFKNLKQIAYKYYHRELGNVCIDQVIIDYLKEKDKLDENMENFTKALWSFDKYITALKREDYINNN